MSLSAVILLALCLGLATGLFFGELVGPVKVVGDGFVLLLQMTVLPYVSISLMTGLGSLQPEGAARLAIRAGTVLLVVWGLALCVVLLFPLGFPAWESASFFSTSLTQSSAGFDFLSLFIPANPFRSLSEAIVPSVVVFSVAVGIALIGVEEKAGLLRGLEALQEAMSRITKAVVRLAPFGIFAIAAYAGGTLSIDQAASLQVYMLVYALSAAVLALWTLPGLVATLTPWRWRDVVGKTRGALVTAFATGNVFVVLSVLTESIKELVEDVSEDIESDHNRVEVVVPVAFTFPSAGKLISLAFVLFAGWISGYALSLSSYPQLLVAGLSSYFGATVVAIPFLLDMFQIPSDTFQLFLVADNVVGTRFGAMLAAMHLVTLALLTVAAMAGKLTWSPVRLGRWALITLLLTLVPIIGVRQVFEALGHDYEGYDRFVAMQPLYETVPARVEDDGELAFLPEAPAVTTLQRVRERGVLRVGYMPDRLPWAFRNADGTLVGFDVEMAHVLARELGVSLEFTLLASEDLLDAVNSGRIDIAMSGIPLTTQGLEASAFTRPYMDETIAFVTRDHDRDRFSSRAAVQAARDLTIAAPPSHYYIAKLKRYLPAAEVVEIETPRHFFRAEPGTFDALLYTAESGSAWSLIYPEFTVAVPKPDLLKVPLSYAVQRGDLQMLEFMNRWIGLKHRDQTLERLFDHWILGRATEQRAPRWSVIRDVLGWVD